MRHMAYQVTILNTRHSFQVQAGETLLQAALRQEVPLSWGCGGGICGVCMVQVVSGTVAYPEGHPLALFDEDEVAGRALPCVGQVRSDLVLGLLELPPGDGLMPY